jgi:hypothetical protein
MEAKHKNKQFLTLFIVLCPTLIVAMASAIVSVPVRVAIQVVLILFQMVVVKNIIDDYTQ